LTIAFQKKASYKRSPLLYYSS